MVPLAIAVFTIPFIVNTLGDARAGILSLAWMTLGYFALFDMGLGRATVKFIAEALGKGEAEKLPGIVWTSLATQVLLGFVGTMVLAALTPVLTEKVFKIPHLIIGEAKISFLILAASVPILLASSVLQGVLEASQRFDLSNLVKVPSSSLNALLPAAGILLGFGLPQIVLLLVLNRMCAAAAYVMLSFRVYPDLRKGISYDSKVIRPLFSYGGWVSVSNMIGPVLAQLERFLIASLLSVGMVTFYAYPYDMVSKVLIFPASMTLTIFPAFGYYGRGDRLALNDLFSRPLKYLLFITAITTVFLTIFADKILGLWLGQKFVEQSTLLFQILAISSLVSAFSHMPFTAVQGLGRPDLKAKLDIFEVVLFAGASWGLISIMGINGAAVAKLIIATVDAIFLFWFSKRLIGFSPRTLFSNILGRGIVVSAVFACIAYAIVVIFESFALNISLFIACVGVYSIAFWKFALDDKDRAAMLSIKIKPNPSVDKGL